MGFVGVYPQRHGHLSWLQVVSENDDTGSWIFWASWKQLPMVLNFWVILAIFLLLFQKNTSASLEWLCTCFTILHVHITFAKMMFKKHKKTHHLKILQCILSYTLKKNNKNWCFQKGGVTRASKKNLRWFKIDLFHPNLEVTLGVNSPPQKGHPKNLRGTRNIQKLNGVSVGIIN